MEREQNEAVRVAENGQTADVISTEESCRRLSKYVEDILQDVQQARLETEGMSQPCKELGETLRSFQSTMEKLVAYSVQLSEGQLAPEFLEDDNCLSRAMKRFHDNLEQLTWQAKQVAQGDYSQQVLYSGEFSQAFNTMIHQLEEREDQLKKQIRQAQRRAEIIESYTEMLVDLLDQRDEWLVIVDMADHQVVHCNKKPKNNAENGPFCDSCKQRLPIQHKLLKWDPSESYKVWEEEEKAPGACYRIISFPIEWKTRPSCVHIVMDVTEEKMRARHLSDDIYHDPETGTRSRLFLEEFMGQVLRERYDVTLCYLDLEGVEEINTSYGRKVGDAYIQNFVEIIRKNFRSSDTFVRVRDDKFCLILTGIVKHLIERKMAEILTYFRQDEERIFGHRCSFKFSIIEVEGESNEMTLNELLQEAERSIRQEKWRLKAFQMENW